MSVAASQDKERPDLEQLTLSQEASAKCEAFIEDYKLGRLQKADTLISISSVVGSALNDDQADFAIEAVRSYLAILDNFGFLRSDAHRRGRSPARSDNVNDLEDTERRNHDTSSETSESEDEHHRTQAPDRVSDSTWAGIPKRARSPISDVGLDELQPHKRRVEPSAFPWIIHQALSPSSLSPELAKTQSILTNFARDPKFTKSSLLNSARCPQFPNSEWDNIIAGRSVDLDHVFSGLYSVSPDDTRKEKLGSLEVIVGYSPLRVLSKHTRTIN